MAAVTKLRPSEAMPRSPARQQLAEIRGRQAALNVRIEALRKPTAARQAAMLALPSALEAMKGLLLERELTGGNPVTLETAKAEVLKLRATVAENPDKTAEIAALQAEANQLSAAHVTAHRQALIEAVDALTAVYHRHAKPALVAERSLEAIRVYCAYIAHYHDIAVKAAGGTRQAHDVVAADLAQSTLRQVLLDHETEVKRWCEALQGDPDAHTEPMADVIARLPSRPEERAAESESEHAA